MYLGPPIDDLEILAGLPGPLIDFLRRCNGYVAFHGGLHIRGACFAPEWHSLRAAWHGPVALHRQFPAVLPSDVPFGEDALGDQFLLREGSVWRLRAEQGEIEELGLSLSEFDIAAREDPVQFLSLQPLLEFRSQGGMLEPGQLLSVYPPFVMAEAGKSVSYEAICALDRRTSLAALAAELKGLANGTRVRIEISG